MEKMYHVMRAFWMSGDWKAAARMETLYKAIKNGTSYCRFEPGRGETD